MGTPLTAGVRRWLLPGPLILLLFAGATVVTFRGELGEYVGFAGLAVGLVFAAVLMRRRSAALSPNERRAWRPLTWGLLLMWSGVIVVGGLSELGVDVPAFGFLDVTFLGGYAAISVALYRLAKLDSGGREWVLTLLDALVGGIALSALVWTFLFNDLMAVMSNAPLGQAIVATIYPIADIVIVVGLLILVLRRSHYYLDKRLVFFAIGVGTQVTADLLFLTQGVGQDFGVAEPLWAVNLIAVAFLILTASVIDVTPKKREFPEAPTPIWAVMWPYLLAALLVGVHFETYRDLSPGNDKILLLDAAIVIGAIIFLRQVYVIYRDRDRVDEKRSELVASVSHELRTPLTAMVGFLSLLDEHDEEFPPEARREMIAEAAGQARHMSRLVSDLLMLARGNTSYMNLEIHEVRAMAILTSVLRGVDPGDVRIEEDLEADVVVKVDPDRMKQALANLINNAVRYGGDHCLVVARVEGRDLVFEVHDNGEGVPTRFESMIWQHFERGAHRLDAVTPGLGIGLSIVQAVMETHGGSAEYRRSERLGGACFSLKVPDCVVDEQSVPARVAARSN